MSESPTREELVEARERLKEQLAIVANPIRGRDRNPYLIAKLKAMIDDINECLSEPLPEGEALTQPSSELPR